MTDYFSKWAEANPLQDKTASGVAETIFNTFCRLGCAAIHILDQGKEFCSELVEHLYKITGKFTNNNVGGKVFDVPINLPVLLNIKSAHACDQNYPCKSEYIALRDWSFQDTFHMALIQ